MKLQPPIKDFSWRDNISQLFGVNREMYSRYFNIPGHNAIDIRGEYGTPILAAHDGTIEKIIYDVPHKTKGNGIYLLSTDKTFSTNYWHLAGFECQIGQEVKTGQVIGLMGNSGWVRPKPTPSAPHNGTHLHFGKKIHGLTNYYNGFVDPTPFLDPEKLPVFFVYNLFLGKRGDHVSWLQTILKCEGFGQDYEPIATFGHKTLRDVIRLQKKYGITPAYGYVGLKTRTFLNQKWSVYH